MSLSPRLARLRRHVTFWALAGGARIPRTDQRASRLALVAGGVVAAIIGTGIGIEWLVGIG